MGFKVNPYDPCVANRMVNGTRMTVTWHVDNLKITHAKPQTVNKFILALGKIYGDGVIVTREQIYSYLGMDFDFSTPGAAKLVMIKYTAQILEDFPELITSAPTSPER